MLLFSANAKIAKMIFLILILWVGISEQRSPEVQLKVRPEVATTSPQVTVTSVQLERTEWSPTTVKIHEQSIQTRPDVTTQPTESDVTVEPVVMTEAVIMSKPEVKPSETTKLTGVSIRGARPDYNEDGTVNVAGQYIGRVLLKITLALSQII